MASMSYDIATLNDIQKRLNRGWVIRKDEMQTLINMAHAHLRSKGAVNAKPQPVMGWLCPTIGP